MRRPTLDGASCCPHHHRRFPRAPPRSPRLRMCLAQDRRIVPGAEGAAVTDPLWALAGLAAASAPFAAGLAARARHRRRHTRAAIDPGKPSPEYHLPPTTEAAEREMAVLLRRMRAYLRDPYDFAASRITGEAAFEDCLDRAAALGARIAELGGAAPACPAERERMRGLILEGLLLGRRMVGSGATPGASHAGPGQHPARPSAHPSGRTRSTLGSSAAGRTG